MLFRDWKRVFSQVCAYSPSKLEGLIGHYGVAKGKNVGVEKLMFAVHTYYTLVMKNQKAFISQKSSLKLLN
jgi:hypothetical protein